MIAAEHCRDLVVGEAAADEGLGQTRQMVDAFQTANPKKRARCLSVQTGSVSPQPPRHKFGSLSR
jgi:hypothetical protein